MQLNWLWARIHQSSRTSETQQSNQFPAPELFALEQNFWLVFKFGFHCILFFRTNGSRQASKFTNQHQLGAITFRFSNLPDSKSSNTSITTRRLAGLMKLVVSKTLPTQVLNVLKVSYFLFQIPKKSIILLHACAHNPTGVDPSVSLNLFDIHLPILARTMEEDFGSLQTTRIVRLLRHGLSRICFRRHCQRCVCRPLLLGTRPQHLPGSIFCQKHGIVRRACGSIHGCCK